MTYKEIKESVVKKLKDEEKLAQKLKDAGFPIGNIFDNELELPSLSELIEACGDKFRILGKSLYVGASPWFATGEELHLSGQTPVEAVANLWIKLNEKHE